MPYRRIAGTAAVVVAAACGAQSPDSSVREPTLPETAAWLSADALSLMTYRAGGSEASAVVRMGIADCKLSWESVDTLRIYGVKAGSFSYVAALADLDVQGGRVDQLERGKFVVVLVPQAGRPPIEWHMPGPGLDSTRAANILVRSESDGRRVLRAISRAAVLCGAPSSPY